MCSWGHVLTIGIYWNVAFLLQFRVLWIFYQEIKFQMLIKMQMCLYWWWEEECKIFALKTLQNHTLDKNWVVGFNVLLEIVSHL